MLKSIIRAILVPLFRILFRVRIEGDVHQFRVDKLLIIANHESFLDGLILGLFLPVNAVFVVHTGVARNPFFRVHRQILDLT